MTELKSIFVPKKHTFILQYYFNEVVGAKLSTVMGI